MSEFKLGTSLSALLFLLLLSAPSNAVIDVYEFETDAQRAQYQSLTKILRCPKCQNQDIADSNAPIASDMRREVHRLILDGHSEQEIVDFMVERFDEFVTYKPKVSPATYALWYGPWILLVLGLVVVALIASKRRRATTNAKKAADGALNAEQKKALENYITQMVGTQAEGEKSDAPHKEEKGA